jgi:hypothetical protein
LRDGKNYAVNKVDLVTKALMIEEEEEERERRESLLLERFVEWLKK